MRKFIYTATAIGCCALFAACSKSDSNNVTPQPTGTSAKFSITFPSVFQMDSIVYSYQDATNKTVQGTVTGVSSWQSPAITYTSGKTAVALVTGYGKVSGGSAGNSATLYLIKAEDQTVITAQGSNSTSGSTYRFTGSINHTF